MTKNSIKYFLLISLFLQNLSYAEEICSRTAIINYQKVLVDTSSNGKGEGLRYYLEKDTISEKHLNDYRRGNQDMTVNAILGTTAIGLFLAGLVSTNSADDKTFGKKELLMSTGLGLFITNFVVYRFLEKSNELHLQKAVDEYNNRNLPRIYFSPFQKGSSEGRNPSSGNWGLFGGLSQEF